MPQLPDYDWYWWGWEWVSLRRFPHIRRERASHVNHRRVTRRVIGYIHRG